MMLNAGASYGDDMSKDEKMMHDMEEAQMAFTTTIVVGVVMQALDTFRYRNTTTSYYTLGDTAQTISTSTGATNYWKTASQIKSYSFLAVGTVMAITQILSMTGSMAATNLMVWTYGGMILNVTGLIYSLMMMYAYDSEHITDNTAETSYQTALKTDMLETTLMGTAAAFELWLEMENWVMAQYYQMCEGDLETCEIAEVVEWKEMKMDDKMDKHALFRTYLGF